MIRTEMGAADLTSSVMAAPAEGEAFFELGMKYASELPAVSLDTVLFREAGGLAAWTVMERR